MIQQFRMRRRLGAQTEVADGPHEAFAEVLRPDAVHDHASGEGIVPIRDGFRQIDTAAAGVQLLRRVFGEDL